MSEETKKLLHSVAFRVSEYEWRKLKIEAEKAGTSIPQMAKQTLFDGLSLEYQPKKSAYGHKSGTLMSLSDDQGPTTLGVALNYVGRDENAARNVYAYAGMDCLKVSNGLDDMETSSMTEKCRYHNVSAGALAG